MLFLLLLARSPLLVCGTGGAAYCSLRPIVAVGLSHFQLGGTRGTRHFCTCLQICKLTCHWCLLGLFWGECDVLLLFCFLLRGSPFEDFTLGCPRLGARDSCESTPWLVVCSGHQWFGRCVS